MAPALDLGKVVLLRKALEIFGGQLFGGRALPGEFLADVRVFGHSSFALRFRLQIYTFERYSEYVTRLITAFTERFSSAATISIGLQASTSIRRRLSSSGVQGFRANAATSPSPSVLGGSSSSALAANGPT